MYSRNQCGTLSTHSFFFNDTATTEIYTLSLHDALPIYDRMLGGGDARQRHIILIGPLQRDRKSTRLNSSHLGISYAVFCLKKTKMGRRARPPPATIGDSGDCSMNRGRELVFLRSPRPIATPLLPPAIHRAD